MGAAQSKKRRKERRRKKKLYLGMAYDLGVPRSASAGVLGISRPSCAFCTEFGTRRTLAASLELSQHHLHHQCLQRQHEELAESGDGYESCPSYSTSNYCLTNSRPDVDKSTMSLNRNMRARSSVMVQSKSSEFSQLLDMLNSQEIWREKMASKQSTHPVVEGVKEGMPVAPPATVVLSKPTQTISTQTTYTPLMARSQTPSQTIEKPSQSKKEMSHFSVLEDAECRQTRREKQKLMAQQLRILRTHLLKQEVMPSENPLPFPFVDEKQNEESSNFVHTVDKHVPSSESEIHERSPSDLNAEHESAPNTPRKTQRSKFSKMSNYRYLDNHPVLSKLQNEQNNRLECMEKRMKEIRISAMQEAERRKFAEFFPAKKDNSQTEKMFQEARETLEKIKEEKRKKKDSQFNRQSWNKTRATEEDSGEIIPIQIQAMPHQIEKYSEKSDMFQRKRKLCEAPGKSCDSECKTDDENKKSQWLSEKWPYLNLSHPLTWLMLPFLMFPLILRMILSLIFNTTNSHDGNTNSSSRRSSVETGKKKP